VKLDENATHFDKIAAAAHQKFNTLAATVMESMVGRKVMAAIVMTSDQISIDSGCVISLATGQCYLVIDTHTHPFSSPFSGTKLQATNRVPRPVDRGTATRYGG